MTFNLNSIVAKIAVQPQTSTNIAWLFNWNSYPNDETSAFHLNNLEERSSLSSFTIRVKPTVEEFDEDSPEFA